MISSIAFKVFVFAFFCVLINGTNASSNVTSVCTHAVGDFCRTSWDKSWRLQVCKLSTDVSPCNGTFHIKCEAYLAHAQAPPTFNALSAVNGTFVSQCKSMTLAPDFPIFTDRVHEVNLVCSHNKLPKCDLPLYVWILIAVVIFGFIFVCVCACVCVCLNKKNRVEDLPM